MPREQRQHPKQSGKTVKIRKSQGQRKKKQALTADELYERAQAALAFDNYDAALECMRDALELEPENLEVLDAYGALLAELGSSEQAIQVLQRAVQLSPDAGFEKYMYLSQLLEEQPAMDAASKGVQILQQAFDTATAAAGAGPSSSAAGAQPDSLGEDVQTVALQLCQAICSLAEMKMAAADDLAEVSQEAEGLLRRAAAIHPSSPEPLQALASLKYEAGQQEEARELLHKSLALWFQPEGEGGEEDGGNSSSSEDMEEDAAADDADLDFRIPKKPATMSEDAAAAEADGAEDMEEYESDDEDEEGDEDDGPSFEFRFEAAKLLLELEDTTDKAIQVLEDLLAENDSVLDVWHLLGLAYYSGGQLEEAEEVTAHGLKLMQQQQVEAEEDIAVCFADLQSAISEAKAGAAAQ